MAYIYCSEEIHHKVKTAATAARKSMAEFVADLVDAPVKTKTVELRTSTDDDFGRLTAEERRYAEALLELLRSGDEELGEVVRHNLGVWMKHHPKSEGKRRHAR